MNLKMLFNIRNIVILASLYLQSLNDKIMTM